MKRVICFLLVYSLMCQAVFATEASKFAAQKYAECINKKAVITVKKEHTEECFQKIGDQDIPFITYGYGDLKVKGKKKLRISYICLRDKDYNLFWSCIIPR